MTHPIPVTFNAHDPRAHCQFRSSRLVLGVDSRDGVVL